MKLLRIIILLFVTLGFHTYSAAEDFGPHSLINDDDTLILTSENNDDAFAGKLRISTGRSVRQLAQFNDTFISRSADRHYVNFKPKVLTDTLSARFEFGSDSASDSYWRLDASFSEGQASREFMTITDPHGTTATISLDGVYLEPGKFVPSQYTTNFELNETTSEFRLLKKILDKKNNDTLISAFVGPLGSMRDQKIDIDYIAYLDYWLGPAFADRSAVHYIRENLDVKSGGISADVNIAHQVGQDLSIGLDLTLAAYLQRSRFSGYDCLSGAFGFNEMCDGLHHLANTTGGEYYSHVRDETLTPGAKIRVAPSFTKRFGNTSIELGGFFEAKLNDPSIENPSYDRPHAARIKHSTTTAYGWSGAVTYSF